MANSTSNIDGILQTQSSKEVTANAFFDAASHATVYGRRASTSSGLTWGFYGGNVVRADGALITVANGTLTLSANLTQYIVAQKSTGTVSVASATTNWNDRSAYWRLYSVVTGASTVTSYTDAREMATWAGANTRGWDDVNSPISNAGVPPSNAPTLTDFGPAHTPQRREFAFAVGDYVFAQALHINHNVRPGGVALIHMHWSTSGTSTATVKWEFTIQRAKGFGQEAFSVTNVCFNEQAATGTAWTHYVSECDISDALTLTEPDELFLVTVRRVTNGGTDNADAVFGLEVDFHIETQGLATPNKSPNFYA